MKSRKNYLNRKAINKNVVNKNLSHTAVRPYTVLVSLEAKNVAAGDLLPLKKSVPDIGKA
jgi:hypothetical protein